MTHFIKNGSTFMVASDTALDMYPTLPVGTYTVKQDPMTQQYYLEVVEGFEVKGKIYGDTTKNAERILSTFEDRPASTGVMLSGEKGSGKTLLAKLLSLTAMGKGMPTIVINQAHYGEGFNTFMQTIDQPTVVLFDEFEKVYDKEDQEKMLTLLDGVYPSKKLFIITCNDKYRVNHHMVNRPGRIFYHMDYAGLDTAFITEYCEDNLQNKSHIDAITRFAMMFSAFNFDMLKAMVEEMNRYDESPQEAMKLLNAKPESSEKVEYDMELSVDGTLIPKDKLNYDGKWRGNPLSDTLSIYYYIPSKHASDDDDDEDYIRKSFTVADLHEIDPENGKFTFIQDKHIMTLTKVIKTSVNYWAY